MDDFLWQHWEPPSCYNFVGSRVGTRTITGGVYKEWATTSRNTVPLTYLKQRQISVILARKAPGHAEALKSAIRWQGDSSEYVRRHGDGTDGCWTCGCRSCSCGFEGGSQCRHETGVSCVCNVEVSVLMQVSEMRKETWCTNEWRAPKHNRFCILPHVRWRRRWKEDRPIHLESADLSYRRSESCLWSWAHTNNRLMRCSPKLMTPAAHQSGPALDDTRRVAQTRIRSSMSLTLLRRVGKHGEEDDPEELEAKAQQFNV